MGRGRRGGERWGRTRRDREAARVPHAGDVARDERMRWLMRFVETDLRGLDVEPLRDVAREAIGFVDYATWSGRAWKGAEAWMLHYATSDRARGQRETRQLLVDAQREVRDGWAILSRPPAVGLSTDLTAGATTQAKHWPVWTMRLWGVTWSVGRLADGSLLRAVGGSWRSAFLAFAADLTTEHWDRLRTCARAGCGERFLPAKGKQRACSEACRRKLYRAANPRDYRAEWTARQLKRTGARRLKIRRRPR